MIGRIKKYPAVIGIIAVAAAVVLADVLAPPPIARSGGHSSIVLDRNEQWLHAFADDSGMWRFRADLEDIDPLFIDRLLLIEDKRFRSHIGVDALAILRASYDSMRAGRIVSGASTITMQTARLLEPRPRTLPSKIIEMFRALQIERRLSKNEILELYLTLAPYGGNIEGIRAASLIYFGKEPARLNDAEQALLIALPQSPEARRPDLRPGAARVARKAILEKLNAAGAIAAQRMEEAANEKIPEQRHLLPRYAYHAAFEIAQRTENTGAVVTTLDKELQLRAEQIAKAYAGRFSNEVNAAFLVIENKTRTVRAAVGSPGLDRTGGWIDMTSATRSPGSTLKPFIYAMAFDDGLAGPSTVISDMPRAFSGYMPENFDRSFRGDVRVKDALQHSLNVPAVLALDKVGPGRFAALLGFAGVNLRTPESADKRPGLALALGGTGVTAREIGVLYSALGDGGRVLPLAWTPADETSSRKPFQLFSEDAAERVSQILLGGPTLAGRAPAELSLGAIAVAYKTGTSYGYRDAWAAGHANGYSVVVWVGHADGSPRPGWTGRKAAAPLLFEIFDMLKQQMEAEGFGNQFAHMDDTIAGPARFQPLRKESPPQIIFPADGVEVFLSGAQRGFVFAARGGERDYRWYVDGEQVTPDEYGGQTVWRPGKPGFHQVVVVDKAGRSAKSQIRVHGS